jgi:hypothetical protein
LPELSLLRRVCTVTLTLLGVTVIGLSALQSPAPPGGDGQCSREMLSTRPGWTNSAVWTNDGRVLVVDNVFRRILLYTEEGRSLGTIPRNVGIALGEHYPRIIQPKGTGYVLELSNERMVVLDRDFAMVQSIDLKEEARKGDTRIDSVFLWTVAGGELVVFSDLRSGRPQRYAWISAFIRFPLAVPGNFAEILRLDSSETRVFYRLGHSYLTAIGDTAYLLLMDGAISFVRFQKGRSAPRPLQISGLPLGRSPLLPPLRVSSDLAPLMKAVEQSAMPVGLYGWEGFLYLLSRRPSQGVTEWTISKIDPQKSKLTGTAVLRTHANHLTVAPGPRKWAFLEKGPVRGPGQQEIKTVLFVPSSRFRESRLRRNLCD